MDTFRNFAIAQVVTPPSPPLSGVSLAITPGTGAYMPPVPFTITVFDGASYATPINAELIRVTAIVGDTLSGLVRAIEGSTARAIKAGDYVAQTFTAQFVADLTNSSNQASGTLPDARLSANVPLLNADNVFALPQQIVCANPQLVLIDTASPIDARRFNFIEAGQLVLLQFVNDANTVQQGAVYIDRTGVVTAAGLGATPLNATNLTTGQVPDNRLAANIPRTNVPNTFTANQSLSSSIPRLTLVDTSAAADKRVFQILNYSEVLHIDVLNDAQSGYAGASTTLDRAGNLALGGDLLEKNRSTPMGHWIDVPFSAANFGASGSGTWTVSSAPVCFKYALVGKTAHIQLIVGTSTVAGAPTSLNLALPFTLAAWQSALFFYNVGASGNKIGTYLQQTSDIYMRLQVDPFFTPFTAGAAYIYANFTVQIQ